MSDQQTTQAWNTAATNIDSQITTLEDQFDLAENQKLENAAQVARLRGQLNSLPPGSAERAAIDQQIVQLDDKNRQLTATQGQLTTQISSLSFSSASATQQATASSTGVPNTSVVPPPGATAGTTETPQQVTIQPVEQVASVSGTTVSGPATQESVFDPRQDPAESVFDPGTTYGGPATEESVFDPRQDVGENVFDPAGAVPNAAVTEAAARLNDPYYGLTAQQLKDLGGADPTDPYIRARLGIPQLPGSTLNPGGFAAYRPTGVPLIDNAVSAISSFASSLGSFFGVTTKPTVTTQGTTTGAAVPTPNTAAVAASAAAVKEQNPNLTANENANLTNIQAANAEVIKAEDNIQTNNRTILAAEEGVATARETQRNAEAIIAQNNAELADENLPDDRRAVLEANNSEQYASIAENARYIDDTSAVIEGAEQNTQQQRTYIRENQAVIGESSAAFRYNTSNENVFDPRQDVGENVFDPGTTYGGPATEESVFDPRQDVGESVFDPGTTYGGPATEESVFDPRQDPAESVFDPGTTYGGPATEESVFDPRQDVGENVFDPDSAIPNSELAGAAAAINDPYYGLTPEQIQALGGADPTDPYIRARLGIPQLPDSTLNPSGFATFAPTGVPLIDGAVSAISSFTSSLSNLFSPPTKTEVTQQGTTTGAAAPAGVDTKAAAADAAAVKEQNPELAAAAKENLTNIEEANANVVAAEENIAINNQSIQANEQAQAEALEQQRNAEAIIAQNNAELADDNLPDDRRAELEANNAAQRASIAENAAIIDEAQANIDASTANNEQQANSILENQYVVDENAEAFRINTTGGVDENGDPVNNTANDPEFNNYGSPEYDAETDGPLTDPGTQELTEEETAALFDEAEATVEAPPVAEPGQPGGTPQLTDAEIAAIYGTTDPQEVGAIQGTSIVTDEARAALSDPETIKAQEALNREAAENPAIIPDVVLEDDPSLTIPEGDETGPPTEDEAVDPAEDPELPEATLEPDPDATIPEDVPPEEDPGLEELEEPPGTEGEITDLAEPVDEETDPELLAGEEEEPFTDLAEPVDPDEDPGAESELLAGEEDLGPYTDLAEPPTDEPEQLGDPDLEDGEITDLAEPVDPDADPELEQLGDPALQEEADTEAEQLSGPTDVDTGEDPGVPDGLSDEEILARQNPGGLSDEEILARQEAAQKAADKANTINQATLQSRYKQPGNTDWRVRLSLAQSSDYLYNVVGKGETGPGILAPLAASNGVIFPYMPQISTMYRASYAQYDLIHSNFRGVYYQSSRVDDIQIRGTFTAQDTTEAAYLLATIHFFRSVTKMFYGKDAERGTPPPLVFLSGLGDYQFSKHPCLVSQFSYTLPNDVDYIRATNVNDYGGNLSNRRTPTQVAPGGINFAGARRLANTITSGGQPLAKGATPQTPQQNDVLGRVNNTGDFSTYVPTMMEIDITLVPVQTRSQVSKQFSLKDFANGSLLRGGFW